MPKGPLRQSIEDFASTSFPPDEGPGWWDRVKTRWHEYWSLYDTWVRAHPYRAAAGAGKFGAWFDAVTYALFGPVVIRDALRDDLTHSGDEDISDQITEALKGAFSHPAAREIAEALGTVAVTPIVSILEQYADDPDPDPLAMGRAFAGEMIALNIGGGLADTLVETLSAGQIEGVGRAMQSVYWTLGLGFLGWQIMAPLLESGMQPNLNRHFRTKYRPERFSASDLRDLYALGEIGDAQMKGEAAALGWRDQDIDQWIKLAFRTLNQGDIWQLYHEGVISEQEATKRLRALGYSPDDIILLFAINPKPETDEARNFTVGTARQAYREYIMPEAELRGILAELNYSDREIDIIIALENVRQANQIKSLTLGQIKTAWTENVLTDAEARHWLEVAEFGTEEVDIILDTWRQEVIPEFRKLNIGTITGAYVEAVLTRSEARNKLLEIGLNEADATLQLDFTEARNPDVFEPPPPPETLVLSPSQLRELVQLALITPDQMTERLINLAYTPEDAALLTSAAVLAGTEEPLPLPQRSIERAYIAGIIDRPEAQEQLQFIGFEPEDADQILDTVEAENPEAFGAPPEERIRELTAGTLEDLLIGGLISPEEMTARLIDLDYTESDAQLLTARAKQFTVPPVRMLTQSTIERAYLAAILTRTEAEGRLNELGFEAADIQTIVNTWEADHPEIFNPDLVQSFRLPSITALVGAVNKGIISVDEYFRKAADLGYQPGDANLYLALSQETEIKQTRDLSTAQILGAYDRGIMPRGEALSRLHRFGYADPDAILIMRTRKDFIEFTETWYGMLNDMLTADEAIAALIDQDYSDEDILAAFRDLPPQDLTALGVNIQELEEFLTEFPGGA